MDNVRYTLKFVAILSMMARGYCLGSHMKSMSAKDAKNAFGLLLDTARAEPVTIEKHGRPVVVVVSIEEFERLSAERRSTRTDVARGNKSKD